MNDLKTLIVFILCFLNGYVFAQEEPKETQIEPKNIALFTFGYTHIPKGSELDSEDANGFFVPAIGLDYIRRVSHKWRVGVMLDYELDHYLVVEKELERENAFIVVAGVGYNPIKHLFIFSGGGIEIEGNANLFVFRFGAEYGFHLKKQWVIAPAFFFDLKEGYDTYAISLGVGYIF